MARLPESMYVDARVVDGTPIFDLPAAVQAGLQRFNGLKVIMTIQAWTQRRSIAANNYYFGVLVEAFSEYTGYTKDECHAMLKQMFAIEKKFVCNEGTGEIIREVEVPLLTRGMSKKRFAEYVTSVEDFLLDIGALTSIPEWSGDKYAYTEAA